MTRTLLLAMAMATVLALGTTLDDLSAATDQAADLEAAQAQAALRARYLGAVRSICGPDAGWMELQDGALQCTTPRGTPTRRVALTTAVQP